LKKLLRARVVALRLLQLRADLAVLRARGGELGARERQLRPRLGIVEPGEDAPSCTRMPSSIRTSVTFPVTLAETVACRRAVT